MILHSTKKCKQGQQMNQQLYFLNANHVGTNGMNFNHCNTSIHIFITLVIYSQFFFVHKKQHQRFCYYIGFVLRMEEDNKIFLSENVILSIKKTANIVKSLTETLSTVNNIIEGYLFFPVYPI